MKHLVALIFWLVPLTAMAQDQSDADKGFLVDLIEENLSGDTRTIDIQGFKGALSSEATLTQMTVADSDGIWLTLENVTLVWNRSALLRGAIDIEKLTAAKIIVARAPLPETDLPAPEATPFALPELPVSIKLGELTVDRVELGESILGEPFAAQIAGSASLADGEGAVELLAVRVDEKLGRFEVTGSYANATQQLALNLDLTEGPSGVVARILELPGQPDLALQLQGDGPIADFGATLALATDGEDRLAGDFKLITDAGQSQFTVDIGGNIAPLFAPEYQEFFGNDLQLIAEGTQPAGGGFDLSTLDLRADNLRLTGSASISAGGWPKRISLNGSIATPTGEIVLLPLPGEKTYVDRVTLDIGYDRSISDDWTAEFAIVGFDRPGLLISQLSLAGGGEITAGDGASVGAVTALLDYAATGLTLDDAAAAEALGDALQGQFSLNYNEGKPITLDRLTLSGAGIELLADAVIATGAENYKTQTNVITSVSALDRFATLVGQPDLAGSAQLNVISTLSPLDGFYDVLLTGETENLAIGVAQLDPLLRGAGNVSLQAQRDTNGTRVDGMRIATDEAVVTASVDLSSAGSDAAFNVTVREVGLVIDGLTGAASVQGTVFQDTTGLVTFDIDGTGPAATLSGTGTVSPADAGQTIKADIKAAIDDLGRYAVLADRPLAGAADVAVSGVVRSNGMLFDADVNAQTRDLQTGIAQLDPLLAGSGDLRMKIARTDADRYSIADLILKTPAIDLRGDAAGRITGAANADLSLTLNDVGELAPTLSGPLNINLTGARDDAGVTTIAVDAAGSGTTLDLNATATPIGDLFDIAGTLDANISDLAPFAKLSGQPLSGAVTADISGTLLSDLSQFDTNVDITTRNLGIGNATVDPLLGGAGSLRARAQRTQNGIVVPSFTAQTAALNVTGALTAANDGTGNAQFQARLADVALLTDQLSGPMTANGTAQRNANNWGVDIAATGPGGIGATVQGQIADNGRLDLNVDGTAPLGLANRVIEPRRIDGLLEIDLAINGPAALSSVSGRLNTTGARISAPTLGLSLEAINGGVALASGNATVDLRADVGAGGGLVVSGPVALSAPFNGNLNIALNDVVLEDPTLYRTTINGQIGMNGPLASGARIAGTLTLGQTDVRVPSSGVGSLGDLPDVVHIGESAETRRTLTRAGENGNGGTTEQQAKGPGYPLDLTINAPSRIFIRGRGLDAELGGTLNIGGTTNNVIPVGQFDLVRGRIDILQQRFDLTEGFVSMQGDFVPYIRLVSETETRTGTQVRIIVAGPANAPEVTFESTPELPQDEVISQLIFGRDISSISPLQAVQLASAVGTLAGRGSGGLVNSFREGAGLDDFDITTDEDGNAALRAGKYLSENIYTDVTINAEGETEINLNLDITSEITAKGTVDADGETSIGVFFERDY